MIKTLAPIWEDLLKQYNKSKMPLCFDFKNAVQKNLGEKRSNNYPHHIHYYPGRIFPYIPLFLFSIQELCPPKGLVLDPFCGSGTILLESIINPNFKRNTFGVEINPLGRLISKVKTTPLGIEQAACLLNQICGYYKRYSNKTEIQVPEFQNRDLWFSKKATRKLSTLRHSIDMLDAHKDYKDFFWLCYSSIIRKVAKADPFIPPPVVLKTYKYKNSPEKYRYVRHFLRNTGDPDILSIFKNVVQNNLQSINILNGIEEIKQKRVTAKIIWDDAKKISLGKLVERGRLIKQKTLPVPPNSIDFIVTSPPYLTAQKYFRTSKLELFWMALLTEKELLALDKESIGTESVSLKGINFDEQTGIHSIDRLIKLTSKISRDRAASVHKYFHDMQKALSEMFRILKNHAYVALVVGNNVVLKKNVETYRLLMEVAELVGFTTVLILKDDIRGRGMITKRHNTGGLIKEEYIIILKK